MRHFFLAVGATLLLSVSNAQTGIPVPGMEQTDNLIQDFLTTYDIPGATVAIAKDGKIVYMRGFGYADIAQTKPTQPYNLFRIASLSKQVTSIAIMKLMQDGLLTMSSKVFGATGLLKDDPIVTSANISDARINDITIQNLLEHTAGWNREINCNPNPSDPYPYYFAGCDAIDFPLRVTKVTGTPNPVTKAALVKFIIEKGLDFAPGTDFKYSNLGYLVLGEVIEKITGKPYKTYVQEEILQPLGIFDMHIANTLLSEKQEREGEYRAYGYKTLSCYGTGDYVLWEYGGHHMPALDANAGWIASSRDMLKLLAAADGFDTKPDILLPATINTMTSPSIGNPKYAKGWNVANGTWWHTGAIGGSACLQMRTANGYTWIIILNRRNVGNANFGTDLYNLGWKCLAATTTWPAWDLMESPTVNASDITFTNVTSNAITVNWTNGNGNKRMLLMKQDAPVDDYPLDGTDYNASADISSPSSIGSGTYVVYNGTGSSATITGLNPAATYYFRTVEYNNNANTGNNSLYLLGNNPQASQALVTVLPINLHSFDAIKLNNNKTRLTWQTGSEPNCDYYVVERSGNGTNYTSIGKLPAINSGGIANYSFIDETPLNGKGYYRLKQVDKNGTPTYSNVLMVDFSLKGNDFSVVPVPGKHLFQITKPAGISFNNAVLAFRNASGQTLLRQNLFNQTTQSIRTNGLARGIYFATIYYQNDSVTKKVVVD